VRSLRRSPTTQWKQRPRSTSVRVPRPGFGTFRVRTRCLLSRSATSRLTAEGSRARAAASAKIAAARRSIPCRSRTRAGVITSRKSAGSSNDRVSAGSSLGPPRKCLSPIWHLEIRRFGATRGGRRAPNHRVSRLKYAAEIRGIYPRDSEDDGPGGAGDRNRPACRRRRSTGCTPSFVDGVTIRRRFACRIAGSSLPLLPCVPGIICLALGTLLVFMERLQILERLEAHLQRRRDNDPAHPRRPPA